MNEIEKNNQIVATVSTQSLIQDLRQIIEQARGQVAATANYAQTMMYWHIGERINREVLGNQRAEYGKQIVSAVSTQLTWSHFLIVMPLIDRFRNLSKPPKPTSTTFPVIITKSWRW